jgi:homoserine O-succinyltransferase
MNAMATPDFAGGAALEIALVNNMPDQALETTKAQFSQLLNFGAQGISFRLRCYTIASVPRSETARRALMQNHDDIEALYARGADALIVTGTEPRADALEQEPYWQDFARLVDWARTHTLGTLWSCLAAHAAVQRLDGIKRRRASQKISGVFSCEVTASNWATQGAGKLISVPHSRYNGLDLRNIEESGYAVCSWSPLIGVDSFWRREPSLFLFTQGHPEYDADTLAREFRRDALRFLCGERAEFPTPPENYFSRATEERLGRLRNAFSSHERRRYTDALNRILSQETPTHAWSDDAGRLYRNWLTMIASEKILGLRRA